MNLLSNKWTLWFHKINDNNWKIDSYRNINTFNSIEYFVVLYREIDNFSAGMFFLMKENILPIWEDEVNKTGGYWSFKVVKHNINSIWKNLSSKMIGNTITKNVDDMSYVNGISLSPKINNCIIKIWLNNTTNIDILDVDLEEGRFVKHVK